MTATPGKVVAVVLNWNGTDDTVACVRSLVALAHPDLEIVVVDNGSRTGPQAALRANGLDLPVVETGRNLGYAGGNNAGIRWALERGAEFVWVLNNDAEVRAGALAPLLEAARRHPRGGVFGSRVLRGDDPSKIWVAWGTVTWRPGNRDLSPIFFSGGRGRCRRLRREGSRRSRRGACRPARAGGRW